jgi:hypothetical protein
MVYYSDRINLILSDRNYERVGNRKRNLSHPKDFSN